MWQNIDENVMTYYDDKLSTREGTGITQVWHGKGLNKAQVRNVRYVNPLMGRVPHS